MSSFESMIRCVVFYNDTDDFELFNFSTFPLGFLWDREQKFCPDPITEEIDVVGLEEMIGEDVREVLGGNDYRIGDVVELIGKLRLTFPFGTYEEPPDPDYEIFDLVHCKVSEYHQKLFFEDCDNGDVEHGFTEERAKGEV